MWAHWSWTREHKAYHNNSHSLHECNGTTLVSMCQLPHPQDTSHVVNSLLAAPWFAFQDCCVRQCHPDQWFACGTVCGKQCWDKSKLHDTSKRVNYVTVKMAWSVSCYRHSVDWASFGCSQWEAVPDRTRTIIQRKSMKAHLGAHPSSFSQVT